MLAFADLSVGNSIDKLRTTQLENSYCLCYGLYIGPHAKSDYMKIKYGTFFYKMT